MIVIIIILNGTNFYELAINMIYRLIDASLYVAPCSSPNEESISNSLSVYKSKLYYVVGEQFCLGKICL